MYISGNSNPFIKKFLQKNNPGLFTQNEKTNKSFLLNSFLRSRNKSLTDRRGSV